MSVKVAGKLEKCNSTCITCGKTIKNARKGVKFCDKVCRNAFHNHLRLRVRRILSKYRPSYFTVPGLRIDLTEHLPK